MTHERAPRRDASGTPAIHLAESVHDLAWWPHIDAQSDAACTVFQCVEVLDVWCDTIGRARNIRPLFVTVFGASGQPALLLPLGIEKVRGVDTLSFLDGGVSDYNAPVVFPEAAEWSPQATLDVWAKIVRALPPCDLAILEKMPDLVEGRRNPLTALATAPHPESCHVITLNLSREEFGRTRFPNQADSRRRRRKLEKLGAVRVEIAETADQRRRFFEAMMRMKRRKFVETKGYDVFTEPGYGDYYAVATERLQSGDAVRLAALLLDDRILAANFGYVKGNCYYDLMPSYEAGEWGKYAPGRLLSEWLIEHAIDDGFKYFDYGIGDEPYKFSYCDTNIPLRDAHIPFTWKGRLYGPARRLVTATKLALRETRLGAALIAMRNLLRKVAAKPGSALLPPN